MELLYSKFKVFFDAFTFFFIADKVEGHEKNNFLMVKQILVSEVASMWDFICFIFITHCECGLSLKKTLTFRTL